MYPPRPMRVCIQCAAETQDVRSCSRCGFSAEVRRGYPILAPELATVSDEYEPAFFPQLFAVEPRSFWFRSRSALIAAMIRRYASSARHVLEVGCGTGFTLQTIAGELPEASLSASDVFPEAFEYASTRVRNAEFVQLDVRRLPYRNEFDLACAFDVIEHVEDDAAAFSELRAALRPGGILMVTVPQHRFLWGTTDELAHHKRRYARGEMLAKLAAAGFERLRDTSFFSLLLPLSLLARSRVHSREDVVKSLTLPALVDRSLAGVMSLERALVLAGLRFPFGGSLLAVARRPFE